MKLVKCKRREFDQIGLCERPQKRSSIRSLYKCVNTTKPSRQPPYNSYLSMNWTNFNFSLTGHGLACVIKSQNHLHESGRRRVAINTLVKMTLPW